MKKKGSTEYYVLYMGKTKLTRKGRLPLYMTVSKKLFYEQGWNHNARNQGWNHNARNHYKLSWT